MSISWNNELEMTLLQHYQAETVLWQTKNKDYKNKKKVQEAWMRISESMNIRVSDLKKKKESLMSSYRSYKKKIKDSICSAGGSGEIYKPIWFAYNLMDSFLGDGMLNTSIKTEEPFHYYEESSSMCGKEEESMSDNVDPEPTTLTRIVRRRKIPSEFLAAEDPPLHTPMNTTRIVDDEDECDLHGRIVAKKLRTIPENERMQFVCEIYSMFARRDQLNQ